MGRAAHGYYILGTEDLGRAERCAIRRRTEARKGQMDDAQGVYGTLGMVNDVLGALGEIAAARALRCPWPARVNTFKGIADLGEKTEVRTSSSPTRSFWLTPRDPLDRWYVYMASDHPLHFIFMGWISGHEARAFGLEWANYRGGGRSFWVDNRKLRRLRDFPFGHV